MKTNWDERFMQVAELVATWSKHPTFKIGCVVVDDDHNQLSGGFNGLPRGIDDNQILDQSKPVSATIHAEANAVAAAARNGHSLKDSTVYVTAQPCCQCAALLIQVGVKRVVYRFMSMDKKWMESNQEAERLLRDARIDVIEF